MAWWLGIALLLGAVEAKDVVYGQGYVAAQVGGAPMARDLTLDAYRPKGEGPFPAVVIVHGGSFQNGSKDGKAITRLAEDLADAGFAAFAINYRKVPDNPPAPEGWRATLLQQAIHSAFVDVKTALRYVRANAAELKVDPARIAVVGESAGAFAALAAGMSDPEDFANDGPELAPLPGNHLEVSARVGAVVDLWGNAELIMNEFTPGDPPVMIVHGTKDYHIGTFFTAAQNIEAACKKAGIPVVLHAIEGAGHGCWDAEINGKPLAKAIAAWLHETLR